MESTLLTLGIALLVFFSKEIIQWARRKFGMIDKNISRIEHEQIMERFSEQQKEDVKLIHKRISDTREKVLSDSKSHANELFERSEEKRQSNMNLMMEKLESNEKVFTAKFDGLENLLKQALAAKNT